MKTRRLLFKSGLFLIPLCIFFLITSCEKDEDNPDYAGSWALTGTIKIDNRIMGYKDNYTFTGSTFSEIKQINDPDINEWLDFFGLKGSILVDENVINFTITEIGISGSNSITGMPNGKMVYYKDTQSGFSDLLSQIGGEQAFSSEYVITGNTMTLSTDYNGDADYDDEGEIMIYLRL